MGGAAAWWSMEDFGCWVARKLHRREADAGRERVAGAAGSDVVNDSFLSPEDMNESFKTLARAP